MGLTKVVCGSAFVQPQSSKLHRTNVTAKNVAVLFQAPSSVLAKTAKNNYSGKARNPPMPSYKPNGVARVCRDFMLRY